MRVLSISKKIAVGVVLGAAAIAHSDVHAVTSTGPFVLDAELPMPSGMAWFGTASAMWHDDVSGTQFAIVGAPAEDGLSGAAYVFSRSLGESSWHQEARLTAADGATLDEFGYAVAMDGNTVVVGAPLHVGDFLVGAVYVFVRDDATGTWAQQGDEISSTDAGFGIAVALHGDTLAVGYSADNAVFTYTRSASAWSPLERISAPAEMSNAGFGVSLAMTDSYLLVGAAWDSAVALHQGSAALYARNRDGWDLQQVLRPEIDTSSNQLFGSAVALSDDAIVIGAPAENADSGEAHAFVFDGATAKWIEQSLLRHSRTAKAHFGAALALSDGLLAIGGPSDDTAAIYHNDHGAWVRDSELDGDRGSLFGTSVATAGGEVLIGAPASDDAQQGAADVFISDRIFADGVE